MTTVTNLHKMELTTLVLLLTQEAKMAKWKVGGTCRVKGNNTRLSALQVPSGNAESKD